MAKSSKEMEIAIKIAGKVDSSLNKALGVVNKGIKGAVKVTAAASAAAAAAVGAVAVASVNVGKEFESAMSQVSATMLIDKNTKEGAAAYQTLEDAARECGRSTAFSATEAAEALNYLALAGYDADEAANALPTVLNLAGAGAMDLATASDMVTDSMSALGIAATETNLTDFTDKMAKAASVSNTSVEQLGEAILTVGGTAKDLAGGTTELDTALGILADNGIKASEGGTHLRNMILSLQNARSADAAAMFEKMGLSAYDASGNMRSLGDIFGDLNKQMDGWSADDINSTLATIFKTTDLSSARAMLAATSDSVTSLQSVVDSALSASGTSIDKLGINLEDMAANFDSTMSSEDFASQMLQQYGMDAESAGVLFEGLSSIVNGTGNRFDELTDAINNSAGACEDMYNIQLDNLDGDVAKLKSGLSDLGISIYKDLNGPLRETTQFATDMVSQLSAAYESGGLEGLAGEVGNVLSEVLDLAGDYAPEVMQMAMSLLQNFVQGIVDNADEIGETGAELVTTFVQGTSSMLPEIINAAVEIALSFANAILEGDGVTAIAQGAAGVISAFINAIIDHLPEILEVGKEAVAQLIQGILDGSDGSIGDIASRFLLISYVLSPLLKIFGGFSGITSKIFGIIGSLASKFGALASAATSVTAPAAAAGEGLAVLAQNATGLLALGAAILMVGGGMALLSVAAVNIANSGPGAAAALVLLLAAVAGMAVGAAALAPALTAGAVGLAAFGAAVTLIGIGILAATAGMSLLAAQLPNIATYGVSASAGILLISTSLAVFSAAVIVAAAALVALFVPMLTGVATTAAFGAALLVLVAAETVSVATTALLLATMVALEVTMNSIADDATTASDAIASMTTGVNIVETALDNISTIAGDAIKALSSAFQSETPSVQSAATSMATAITAAFTAAFARLMSQTLTTVSAIKSAFANCQITIPKPKVPVISTTYSTENYGDGGSVKLPKFAVNWNAAGGIFDQATIMNTSQGLQGAGEAGAEALIPLDTLWSKMRSIMTEVLSQNSGQSVIEALTSKLSSLGTGSSASTSGEPAGAGGGNFVYSPTFNLNGSATKEDVEEANSMGLSEFTKLMNQYEKSKKRKKF